MRPLKEEKDVQLAESENKLRETLCGGSRKRRTGLRRTLQNEGNAVNLLASHGHLSTPPNANQGPLLQCEVKTDSSLNIESVTIEASRLRSIPVISSEKDRKRPRGRHGRKEG